jgi:hypothetical protein
MPSPFEAIERDPAIVYALDRELKILYCNEAWDRFAESNGGAALKRPTPYGMCVLDVIPEPLQTFYRSAYLSVFATSRHWVHEYECSTAAMHRLYRLTALHRPKEDFILVANFLLEERPHGDERPVRQPDPATYQGPDVSIEMCSLCRRTRRRDRRGWDWVPAYVEKPPARLAYSVCASCRYKTVSVRTDS